MTYRINVFSILHYLIIFFSILSTELMQYMFNKSHNANSFLFTFVVGTFFAFSFSYGKVLIQLDNNGVTLNWKKKFFPSFSKNKKLPWSDIESYVFLKEDHGLATFRLNLKDKSNIELKPHGFFDDDKIQFENDFMIYIRQHNLENVTSEQQINTGQNFYQTNWALFLAVLFGLFLLVGLGCIITGFIEFKMLVQWCMGLFAFCTFVYRIRKERGSLY
jgi:hypothetical protein